MEIWGACAEEIRVFRGGVARKSVVGWIGGSGLAGGVVAEANLVSDCRAKATCAVAKTQFEVIPSTFAELYCTLGWDVPS